MDNREIENKLDEDFVFYLGFVSQSLKHIVDDEVKASTELWLSKLCGENYSGIEEKRGRNIYLAQLILCMQNGVLADAFKLSPNEVDLKNADTVFKTEEIELKPPAWIYDHEFDMPPKKSVDSSRGRTYVATRTLPDGQGAFAYVAISLDDEDMPLFGEGEGTLEKDMKVRFQKGLEEAEMEKIMARRKDPAEREKVVNFYKILLQNLSDEIDEKVPQNSNQIINDLVELLIDDLKDREQFGQYEKLDERNLRFEMCLILHDRINQRIKKIKDREELLDEVQKRVLSKSAFETSVEEQDRMELPIKMWEQAIDKAPSKPNVYKLRTTYPMNLVDKFLDLLADCKAEIANRMQIRTENMIAQMKREVRREYDKGKKFIENSEQSLANAQEVFNAVKAAWKKKTDVEKRNKKLSTIPQTPQSKLYDQMRAALLDTQKCVKDEAARGKVLANEINILNQQTEANMKANEEAIKNIEASNMAIMRNIKRLNFVIKQQKERIRDLKAQEKAEQRR